MRGTVIYLDTVLFYNILADDLLLLAAGRIAGLPLQRRRIFAAALFGGVYAAAAVIPCAVMLQSFWFKLPAAALMVWIAFGRKPCFWRRYLLFLLVSGAFAGVELAICGFAGNTNGMPPFNVFIFLASFAFCWLLLGVVFRGGAAPAVTGKLIPLAVSRGGRSVNLTALRDSGCALRDPLTGVPVAVVELACLEALLTSKEQQAIKESGSTAESTLMRLPFHSVGGSGTLAAFRADLVSVGDCTYEDALVAVHPDSLGGETFHALWGGEENSI